MPEPKSNGLWKHVAYILISLFVAGAASWLAFGANKVGRVEVVDIVNTHSPYIEDRKLLNTNLERMSTAIEAQGGAINSLSTTQAVQAKAIENMAAAQHQMGSRLDKMDGRLDEALKDSHRHP